MDVEGAGCHVIVAQKPAATNDDRRVANLNLNLNLERLIVSLLEYGIVLVSQWSTTDW